MYTMTETQQQKKKDNWLQQNSETETKINKSFHQQTGEI